MAKRGRKPAGITIDELEPTLRAEIERAVESCADESARSLFARYSLAQRGVGWASFAKWVGKLRREAKGARIEQRLLDQETDVSETQLIARLRRRVLIEANARAEAGDTKAYELIGLWSRIQDHDRVEIQRAADQRAEQKFAIEIDQKRRKLAEEKRAADEKLDAMMTEKGIPRELGDRIKDLYGLSL